MNESAAKALGVEGSSTDLTLTTIHGTHSVTSKAIEGLVVANVKDESARLELPRTFTQNIIPVDRSEIPRPDVISRMLHLKDVSAELSPYMEDVEVGLLIGLNCPSARTTKRNCLRWRIRSICCTVAARMVHKRSSLYSVSE